MAKIEYLKNAPGALRGAVRTVDSRSAKALVGLGYARYYKDRVVAAEPKPALKVKPETQPEADLKEPQVITEPAPKKRQYKRRDLKAEE